MIGVVIGAVVTEYLRLCPGMPAIVFCIDTTHSKAVAAAFRDAGVKAQLVDGDTPAAERRAAIAALGSGDLHVLTNCGLFGEGVDIPTIGTAILLRPTASLALHLQQIGRALRPAPGKDRAVILDFAGNVGRLGMPDQPRERSLESKPRGQRERPNRPRLRRCPTCGALNAAGARVCVGCGGDLRTAKERLEVEMRLAEARAREEADAVALMHRRERIIWAGADERRLHLVARISGYRPADAQERTLFEEEKKQ